MSRVVDGDTVQIRYPNGTEDTVRLLGVDTPEVYSENTPDEFEGVPDSDAGRACLREYGEGASSYLTDELEGEEVRLEFDAQAGRRGYYDRLLAYVYHDGSNVNLGLVSEGWGRVYDSEFTQSSTFYDAERRAQSSGRRVWSCRDVSTPTPTRTPGSAGGGSLVVESIHADAPGNDHENLNEEYIVFTNDGSATLDISGWTISDEADHEYGVPAGTRLGPGDSVTLYTGEGTDTSDSLYWGSGRAIWNNGGDTIYVRDDSGSLVVSREYS